MNISAINTLLSQIDAIIIETCSGFISYLIAKFKKQSTIPLPLKTILNKALELISIILIVALVLGVYFVSGLHSWWGELMDHIV